MELRCFSQQTIGRHVWPGDALFGTLAEFARWLPGLPLI